MTKKTTPTQSQLQFYDLPQVYSSQLSPMDFIIRKKVLKFEKGKIYMDALVAK